MDWPDPLIIAAFVTGAGSIVLAAVNFFLSQIKSERSAQRKYKYFARKRLYDEFEPLSFQLVELSDIAVRRIRALAKEAKDGYLELNVGWYSSLSSPDMYNLIYRLLAPLAIFRIMQSRLTSVDLALDKSIRYRYLLGKVLYYSFTHDRRLAKTPPKCLGPDYEPKYPRSKRTKKELEEQSKSDIPQGIHHQSEIDIMLDHLITGESDKDLRVMTFTEFEREWCDEGKLHELFYPIGEILLDFHPERRPVLWRILITQAHIHRAIKEIHENGLHFYRQPKSLKDFPRVERKEFNWRKSDDEAPDSDVFKNPFYAAQNYLSDNWREFDQLTSLYSKWFG